MPCFTAKELESKTLEKLAILGERNDPRSAEGIMLTNEFERRSISPTPEIKKKWHEKPFGIILLTVIAGLIVGYLVYYLGWH